MKEKLAEHHKVFYKQSKEAPPNCASAPYVGYRLELLYLAENIVTESYLSDENVGLNNHSKESSNRSGQIAPPIPILGAPARITFEARPKNRARTFCLVKKKNSFDLKTFSQINKRMKKLL